MDEKERTNEQAKRQLILRKIKPVEEPQEPKELQVKSNQRERYAVKKIIIVK